MQQLLTLTHPERRTLPTWVIAPSVTTAIEIALDRGLFGYMEIDEIEVEDVTRKNLSIGDLERVIASYESGPTGYDTKNQHWVIR